MDDLSPPQIESTRRLGPPLHGVVGPGSIHGPFQLYPSCDGLATPEGCIKESPPSALRDLPGQRHSHVDDKNVRGLSP